jgi:isoleucyl-tRNA synthetase
MPFRPDLRPENLLPLEEEVLARWAKEGTFQRALERRATAPRFVFYEGPPTANGRPGIHHVLARAVKDFACRLKTMQGHLVERRAGWDTHGLPVEIEAEKRLGLAGKKAIEEMGIARFNEECRTSVFRYMKDWEFLTRRMGYWVDLERAYVTCDRDYVESLWWILATLHGRGLLFRGHKVLPYCPRCSTPLSSHEVGLGFKDVQDPSVTVRFALEGGEPEDLLVWTTTPWTLPANVAIAANPALSYALVEPTEGLATGQRLWLAEARLPTLGVGHRVVRTAPGTALVGRRYRRLLDWYPVEAAPKAFTVLPADFVTVQEGTGLVHVAPAYGQDDHELGRREGLPTLHPVDGTGRFRPGSPVQGEFVKDADKAIVKHLKEAGRLWRQETVDHAYPHCWRCDSPLLYYARDSWYLKTTAVREQMIRNNAGVTWWPEAVGRGRFGQWLEGNVDWAVSRDRYWGTPLPLWLCDRCGDEVAVEGVEALRRLAGRVPEDLHRPYVDEVVWPCARGGCGGTMRRTPEVADAWFDSGAMPFAQWHYPFENKQRVEAEHPADFISEGVDQTRGWFYTLLAVSTLLTGKPAYKACASLELVLDGKGKKMAKSKGNVVDPFQMIDRHGADVVRWHLLVRPLGTPMRYEEKDLVEIRNRLFGTLLNVYVFFATYANVDGYAPGDEIPLAERPTFDRWLVSRLHTLFAEVGADLEAFDTAHAGQRIADFVVEDLSNWYVRRNRRRFFRAERTRDKSSGYQTLHAALLSVAHLMAPFSPFLADALYRALTEGVPGAAGGVHLARWPLSDAALVDEALESGMAAVRRVVSLGHAARDAAGLKVRQPLRRLDVWGLPEEEREFVAANQDVVLDELNVKELAFRPASDPGATLRASLDKKEAARRLGARTPAVAAALAALHTDGVVALLASDDPGVEAEGGRVPLRPGDVRVEVQAGPGRAGTFGGGVLALLDVEVTPELKREGIAREVLRQLQILRKDLDFAVEDRVRAAWRATGEAAEAIDVWRGWLEAEILAVSFERREDPAGLKALDVPGHEVWAALERA